MKRRLLPLLLTGVLLVSLAQVLFLPGPARADEPAEAGFAHPAFQALWNRTDSPVAAGAVNRPYIWGAQPLAVKTERYDNSPGKQRLVQYFDKGRMEVTYPGGDQSNQWFVSSGLLVRDLISGIVQVGDNRAQVFDPADIPAVGDETDPLETTPRYADLAELLANYRYGSARSETGEEITLAFRRGSGPGERSPGAEPKVTVGYFDTTSQHNIATPFWNFMNSSGLLQTASGQAVYASLFQWQYILGYPLSEPFWVTANFAGKSEEVLLQLFERRALVFNPAAEPAAQVDFTSVGRHWYQWQYRLPPAYEGDTGVPPAVNGRVSPLYGSLETSFSLEVNGFNPAEKLAVTLTQPDGTVYTSGREFSYASANSTGGYRLSFSGADFVSSRSKSEGIYSLEFKGQASQRYSAVYWRIIPKIPRTPATPYDPDTSPPPPGVNASVEPAVGPAGTPFVGFIYPFQLKEMDSGKVSYWVTSPAGDVYGGSAAVFSDSSSAAQETLEGTILKLGSPPTPGIWAITFAYQDRPSVQSIIWLKVTGAPPEVPLGNVLAVIPVAKPASTGPSGALWQTPSALQLRLPGTAWPPTERGK